MSTWHSLKGYLGGAIALIACPCHLPITFPLLLSLTAGTALGSWLAGKFGLVFGLSTVIFIGGLGLAMLWSGNEKPAPRTPHHSFSVPVAVTIVTSSTCKSCDRAKAIGETEGMVKLVAEAKTGVLLGGHILGPHADILIHEVAVAMYNRGTAEALAKTIHVHPPSRKSSKALRRRWDSFSFEFPVTHALLKIPGSSALRSRPPLPPKPPVWWNPLARRLLRRDQGGSPSRFYPWLRSHSSPFPPGF